MDKKKKTILKKAVRSCKKDGKGGPGFRGHVIPESMPARPLTLPQNPISTIFSSRNLPVAPTRKGMQLPGDPIQELINAEKRKNPLVPLIKK